MGTSAPALDTPDAIPKLFVAAWNRRDPDLLASVFEEDAWFVNVVGLRWYDRAAIRKAHAYGLEVIFDRSTLTLTESRVRLLSDDVAVVQAGMRLTEQSPAGGVERPAPRANVFTFVVHRTADVWRCVAAHNTDVVPGAETNVVDPEGRIRPTSYR